MAHSTLARLDECFALATHRDHHEREALSKSLEVYDRPTSNTGLGKNSHNTAAIADRQVALHNVTSCRHSDTTPAHHSGEVLSGLQALPATATATHTQPCLIAAIHDRVLISRDSAPDAEHSTCTPRRPASACEVLASHGQRRQRKIHQPSATDTKTTGSKEGLFSDARNR